MSKDSIYSEITIERAKQDKQWGGAEHDAHHSSNDWVAYLTKHVGRAVHWPWNVVTFRRQMIVVAAVAVAAIEWCDLPGSRVEGQNDGRFS